VITSNETGLKRKLLAHTGDSVPALILVGDVDREVFNLFNIANLSDGVASCSVPDLDERPAGCAQAFGSGGPSGFQVAARVSHLISLVASTRNILIFQFGSSQDFWKKVVEETCELQPGTQR
jgi:hypothetical protein